MARPVPLPQLMGWSGKSQMFRVSLSWRDVNKDGEYDRADKHKLAVVSICVVDLLYNFVNMGYTYYMASR